MVSTGISRFISPICRTRLETIVTIASESKERGKDLAPDLCKALITFVGSVVAPRVAMQCSPLWLVCCFILGWCGLCCELVSQVSAVSLLGAAGPGRPDSKVEALEKIVQKFLLVVVQFSLAHSPVKIHK